MIFEPDDCTQAELDSVHAEREANFERQAQAAREPSRYAAITNMRRMRAANWLREHEQDTDA